MLSNHYPPCAINKMKKNIKLIPKDTSYEFINTNGIKISLSYSCSGTIVHIFTSLIDNDTDIFWASSDYKLEDTSDRFKNKIAIWFDESNIQYVNPRDNTEITFFEFEPGKIYHLHIGYLNKDYNYITDSIYIQTWGINLSLLKTSSLRITCEISSNYVGTIEWWSDQDNTIREINITQPNEIVKIYERIRYRDYTNIYARIKEISDTSSMIPRIYIPLFFRGLISKISGTTAYIKPIIEGIDSEGLMWYVRLTNTDEDKVYTGSLNDYTIINNLTQWSTYNMQYALEYTNVLNVDLNYIDYFPFTFQTYGIKCTELFNLNVNSVDIKLSNHTANITLDLDNEYDLSINTFEPKTYKAKLFKRIDGIIDESYEEFDKIKIENDIAYISGLDPKSEYRIYVYLEDVKSLDKDKLDAITYLDFETLDVVKCNKFDTEVLSHNCILKPNISAWNGSLSMTYKCSVSSDHATYIYQDTIIPTDEHNLIIDNLMPGTKYKVRFEAYDNYGNEVEIPYLEFTTFGIKSYIDPIWIHSRFIDNIEFMYQYGIESNGEISKNTNINHCNWFITSADDINNIIIESKHISFENNTIVMPLGQTEYSVLQPNKRYILWTYFNNLYLNGNNESYDKYEFSTVSCMKDITFNNTFSGTTITSDITWYQPEIKNYSVHVYIDLYDKDNTLIHRKSITSPGKVLFNNLKNGNTYHFIITASDSENNTTNDFITFKDKNNFEVTTYGLSLINVKSTTRSISWECDFNYPIEDHIIEYAISQNNKPIITWNDHKTIALSDKKQYTELKHDSDIDLVIRLTGIYDENGELDVISNAKHLRTRILSVEIDDVEKSPDYIKAHFTVYSNSTKLVKDPISNDKIEPVIEQCLMRKKIVLNTIDYQQGIDLGLNTILFNNLEHGVDYLFKLAATDGYNIVVSKEYPTNTTPSTIHVYNNTTKKWNKSIPYIVHNNRFVKAECYIYHNNKWYLCT